MSAITSVSDTNASEIPSTKGEQPPRVKSNDNTSYPSMHPGDYPLGKI